MFQVKKFDTFSESIEKLVLAKSSLESAQSWCLTKYLSELKVQSYVVESDYTDAGYLLDYANYYSRCHSEYKRSTHRIHYFSLSSTALAQKLKESLESGTFPQEVQTHYQGFVVVKPLPQTIIGRTCLRTYDEIDPKSKRRRVYPLLRKYTASLFGIELEIESIAFQEQDKETAACATAAIWYALHGLPKKITTQEIPSPFEITNISSSTFIKRTVGDVARRFPTGGLGLEQIESYLRTLGLECIVCGIKTEELQEKLKDYLASYVQAGYPMIIVGNMYVSNSSDKNFRHLGLHAITALGYAHTEKFDSGNQSKRIERLFAHDDNVGPFTSFHFETCDLGQFTEYLKSDITPIKPKMHFGAGAKENGIPINQGTGQEGSVTGYLSNRSGRPNVGVTDRKFVPGYLIIPINGKIRLPYEIVHTFARQISLAYERKKSVWFEAGKSHSISWSINLVEVSKLKADLWKAKGIKKDSDFSRLLQISMPKYIWRLNFSTLIAGEELSWVDFLIDATDLLQGGGVLAALKHDLNDGSEPFLSLIIASVREWITRYPDQVLPQVYPLLQTIEKTFRTPEVNLQN